MKIGFAGLGVLMLAGCVSSPPPTPAVVAPPPGSVCKPEEGQRFIGQIATGLLGQQMRAATGARLIRWVPPRTAVTMDFKPDRLTVSYNDSMIIETVACT